MAKKDGLDILSQQIENDFKKAAQYTAAELNFELALAYSNAIEAFYNDYDPDYYQRTYLSYYGSSLTKTPELIYSPIEEFGKITAELIINDAFIGTNPYRADREWVFNRTYMQGIHGQTQSEKRIWGQNRYWMRRNLLKDRRARKLTLKKYKNKGARTFEEWMKILLSKNQKGYRYGNQYKKEGYRYGNYDFNSTHPNKNVAWVSSQNQRSKGIAAMGVTGVGKDSSSTRLVGVGKGKSKIPNDMVFDEYKKLRKPKNVKAIIEKNLLQQILK